MLSRCYMPTDSKFADYGGRGIVMCERWRKFDNFLADMGVKPDGLSIERINNDGNYQPSNCKWATRTEQNRNKRNTKLTAEQVADIRSRPAYRNRRSGRSVREELAEQYGVSVHYVKALRSQAYDHIWMEVKRGS